MIKVIVTGATGHMGKILRGLIEESSEFEVAALVDPFAAGGAAGAATGSSAGGAAGESVFIYKNLSEFEGDADVLIDFSSAQGTEALLDYCKGRGLALVLCTTGQTDEQKASIYEAAKSIPLFFSANMSLGVALLSDMVKRAAAALPDADIEILEIHHNRKVDAPSGTALLLADAAKASRPELSVVTGRSGSSKREANDISISSIRMGDVVGTHEVMFNMGADTITLKHEAHDRALFAHGALRAAKFLVGKPAGLYDMESLVKEL